MANKPNTSFNFGANVKRSVPSTKSFGKLAKGRGAAKDAHARAVNYLGGK